MTRFEAVTTERPVGALQLPLRLPILNHPTISHQMFWSGVRWPRGQNYFIRINTWAGYTGRHHTNSKCYQSYRYRHTDVVEDPHLSFSATKEMEKDLL